MGEAAPPASTLQTVRETELKLSVPDGADLAAMLGPAGPIAAIGMPTTAVLSTAYYDTEDLRLAREGMTLRRRRGDDEGWHLKLPAATGRDEVRTDVAGTAPPPALRSLVRVFTRAAPLRRVATLETTRTTRRLLGHAGELLGVLVDDRVRVLSGRQETGSFREIEVEAAPDVEDPEPLLEEVAERLTTAGATLGEQTPKAVRALGPAAQAPPTPPRPAALRRKASLADVITAQLRADTRALMLADLALRRSPERAPEFAGAAGRLVVTLAVFGDHLPPAAELAAEVTVLRSAAKRIRDRVALSKRLPAGITGLPLPDREIEAAADYVRDRLDAELAVDRAGLAETLESRRYARLVDRLVELATDPAPTPDSDGRADAALPERLAAATAGLDEVLAPTVGERHEEAVDAAARAEQLATCWEPVLGKPAGKYARRAAALREALAAHLAALDAAAAARRLSATATPAVAFALGLLAASEAVEAEGAAASLESAWAAFAKAGTGKGLVPLA